MAMPGCRRCAIAASSMADIEPGMTTSVNSRSKAWSFSRIAAATSGFSAATTR